jgi:hypothetical protein
MTTLERNLELENKLNENVENKYIAYKNFPYAISTLCIETFPCKHHVLNTLTNERKSYFFNDIADLLNCTEEHLNDIHS